MLLHEQNSYWNYMTQPLEYDEYWVYCFTIFFKYKYNLKLYYSSHNIKYFQRQLSAMYHVTKVYMCIRIVKNEHFMIYDKERLIIYR